MEPQLRRHALWRQPVRDDRSILDAGPAAHPRARLRGDRAGAIDFLKPGRGTVRTSFCIDDALLDELRTEAASGERCCAGSATTWSMRAAKWSPRCAAGLPAVEATRTLSAPQSRANAAEAGSACSGTVSHGSHQRCALENDAAPADGAIDGQPRRPHRRPELRRQPLQRSAGSCACCRTSAGRQAGAASPPRPGTVTNTQDRRAQSRSARTPSHWTGKPKPLWRRL